MTDPKQIRILLVDNSEERARTLTRALEICGYRSVTQIPTRAQIWEEIGRINPDVILIDVESPTRDTLEQLNWIRDRNPKPVVLFTQDSDAQSIQAAINSGVSAYVVDGAQAERVRPAIEIAMATFHSFQSLRDELDQTKATLEDTYAINRAKAVLSNTKGYTEDQAYHHLRRIAMNQKRKLADVARNLLDLEDLLS